MAMAGCPIRSAAMVLWHRSSRTPGPVDVGRVGAVGEDARPLGPRPGARQVEVGDVKYPVGRPGAREVRCHGQLRDEFTPLAPKTFDPQLPSRASAVRAGSHRYWAAPGTRARSCCRDFAPGCAATADDERAEGSDVSLGGPIGLDFGLAIGVRTSDSLAALVEMANTGCLDEMRAARLRWGCRHDRHLRAGPRPASQ